MLINSEMKKSMGRSQYTLTVFVIDSCLFKLCISCIWCVYRIFNYPTGHTCKNASILLALYTYYDLQSFAL